MNITPPPVEYATPEGHLNESALAIYSDALQNGLLDQLDPDLREHVEACVHCKQELLLFQKFQEAMEEETGNKDTRKPGNFFSFRLAALFLLVLATAAVVFILFRTGKEKPPFQMSTMDSASVIKDTVFNQQPATEDTTVLPVEPKEVRIRKDVEKPLLAAAYQPHPDLEAMVSNPVRSDVLRIISPSMDAIYSDSLVFAWAPYPASLSLTIRNNRNEDVLSEAPSENRYVLKTDLPQGLYYWTLETKRGIIYVGKFKK